MVCSQSEGKAVSGIAVTWDPQARCYVGRDRHTQILSAVVTRERAVRATAEAVAMVRRWRVGR